MSHPILIGADWSIILGYLTTREYAQTRTLNCTVYKVSRWRTTYNQRSIQLALDQIKANDTIESVQSYVCSVFRSMPQSWIISGIDIRTKPRVVPVAPTSNAIVAELLNKVAAAASAIPTDPFAPPTSAVTVTSSTSDSASTTAAFSSSIIATAATPAEPSASASSSATDAATAATTTAPASKPSTAAKKSKFSKTKSKSSTSHSSGDAAFVKLSMRARISAKQQEANQKKLPLELLMKICIRILDLRDDEEERELEKEREKIKQERLRQQEGQDAMKHEDEKDEPLVLPTLPDQLDDDDDEDEKNFSYLVSIFCHITSLSINSLDVHEGALVLLFEAFAFIVKTIHLGGVTIHGSEEIEPRNFLETHEWRTYTGRVLALQHRPTRYLQVQSNVPTNPFAMALATTASVSGPPRPLPTLTTVHAHSRNDNFLTKLIAFYGVNLEELKYSQVHHDTAVFKTISYLFFPKLRRLSLTFETSSDQIACDTFACLGTLRLDSFEYKADVLPRIRSWTTLLRRGGDEVVQMQKVNVNGEMVKMPKHKGTLKRGYLEEILKMQQPPPHVIALKAELLEVSSSNVHMMSDEDDASSSSSSSPPGSLLCQSLKTLKLNQTKGHINVSDLLLHRYPQLTSLKFGQFQANLSNFSHMHLVGGGGKKEKDKETEKDTTKDVGKEAEQVTENATAVEATPSNVDTTMTAEVPVPTFPSTETSTKTSSASTTSSSIIASSSPEPAIPSSAASSAPDSIPSSSISLLPSPSSSSITPAALLRLPHLKSISFSTHEPVGHDMPVEEWLAKKKRNESWLFHYVRKHFPSVETAKIEKRKWRKSLATEEGEESSVVMNDVENRNGKREMGFDSDTNEKQEKQKKQKMDDIA